MMDSINSNINQMDKNREEIAKEAIKKSYIYDSRFTWVELSDFSCLNETINILKQKGEFADNGYENIVISSIDENNNRRLMYFGNREKINKLKQFMEELQIRGKTQEHEYGCLDISLSQDDSFEDFLEQIRFFLEEKILGYHRIVKPEDIIKSKKYDKKNIIVHEIASPKTFYTAISTSQDNNNHSAFVHICEAEEYEGNKLFLVNAGCAGCAITEDGNIISVFKNNDMAEKDDVEKIITVLLLTAIENGGKMLDCYDGVLPNIYMKHGFIPICKVPFNDEFAPYKWDFERDGRPPIIFFIHNGKSINELLKDISERTYKIYDLDSLPVIEGYDEAGLYRDETIEYIKSTKMPEVVKKGYSYDE